MDLHALRIDEPSPRARRRDARRGRVPAVSHTARDRGGQAAGTLDRARETKMMARSEITTPEALESERLSDAALRPSRLDEFVGQAKVKESLQIAIDAAKQRKEPLDHTLFFGPPGLGKTTLALLMAKELDVSIRTTSGPVLERPGDLVGMLTSLKAGDILFIDEVHRLRPALEEFLYPAMEEFRVDVRIADGPHAQTLPMRLERFTLIGATTRFGLLTPPLHAARREPAAEARARLRAGARRRQDHRRSGARGAEATRRGRVRAGRHGCADPQDHHRAVRGRPRRHPDDRRRRGRRPRYARGGVRAVPDAARFPVAYAARPLRDPRRLSPFQLHATQDDRAANDL